MKQNQFLETYSKFLQKFLKPQKPLKVVFDCSDGVAGLVLKKIKSPQNSKFIILNSIPNGNFPAHGPNPSKPGATKQLQAAVKKNKADLGIIFDADGDRMFCIDDKSRFVDPDVIARLLIGQLKAKKIIIDMSTGWLIKKIKNSRFHRAPTLSRVLDTIGRFSTKSEQKLKIKIIESKVGHYFIKKMMRAENADFGAERSGHYYFREFFGLDSGILAAIEAINAVSELPYKLSDFVELLPKYFHKEIDIGLKRVNPKNLLKAVEQACRKEAMPTGRQAVKISHLDGLTMEFSDWWFNLRFSQTEPLLKLNIEVLEKSKIQKEASKLKKFLQLAAR